MTKKREEYADDLKWNVQDLYQTIEDFNKDYDYLNAKIEDYQKYEGHIFDSPKSLLNLLIFDRDIEQKFEQVYIYAHLQNDQDTTNVFYQELMGKVLKLYEKIKKVSAYIVPELLTVEYDTILEYINKEKGLKEFARNLKDIFKVKKHILSDKEEKVLSNVSSVFRTPDDVYSLLSDADLTFGTIKDEKGQKKDLSEKNYRQFLESNDRKLRKNAFKKLHETYSNFKNTYAALLMAEVNKNNKIAEIRGYKSALNSSLYVNDIPDEIYDNLIKTVKNNISPLSKYWKLKKELLHLPSLHIYDTYASIINEVNKKYTKEQAKMVLNEALAVLGETYIKDLNKAFDEKWIDFCPNKGKRNGAYCTVCYNTHPYVLLSFDGTLNSVSTLAHELGHAMHYYYAIKNQAYQDYEYSIFVAEVASQVNQILLSKYLIASTNDKNEKKYLIDSLIQDFKATIYRQTMFAEFEKIIHEEDQKGNTLTYNSLCDIYYKLNKEYYGKNIVVDDIIKYEWERIPHFYMNFYVYQYATAYAASINIAMKILNGDKQIVPKYLEFLKLGQTKSPIDSLKVVGLDMSKKQTIEDTFDYFEKLVSDLKKLYNE